MAKKIIDIYHQESITSFDDVCNATHFIIHKGTQGTSFVDKKCKERIKAFEERKHPYWIYTFLNKGNELEQAKFLVNTYKNSVGKYFVGYILDIEQNNSQDNCLEALEYLLKQDCKVMFYFQWGSYSKYQKLIAKRSDKCAFWECRYGDTAGNKKGTDRSDKYPFHSTADLGQYTDCGSCTGVSGRVDLNKVTGNGKDLNWFLKPIEIEEGKEVADKKEGCFSINKNAKGLTEFLHNRGFGAGENNLRLIAAENWDNLKQAMFELAQKGELKKPDGLNEWKDQSKKD